MKTAKKIFTLVLCAMMFILPFTACNGKNDLNGKTKVTLWAWGDTAEINAFTKLFQEYNENNTDNIYVDFVKNRVQVIIPRLKRLSAADSRPICST